MRAESRGRWSPFVVSLPTQPAHDPRSPASEHTAGDVATAALGDAVELYVEHESGLEDGLGGQDDPTHVHQARVATRRLRSHLRVFGDVLDRRWADDIRSQLRWLGRLLGDARDPDVLLERLTRSIERLPALDHIASETLLSRLRTQRARAGDELVAALSTSRYESLRHELLDAGSTPRLGPLGRSPAVSVLPPLVEDPWERLQRRVAALGADPTDHALHAVRIATKRSRYATEAVISVVGDPARRLARELRRLQTRLGEHQDSVVAESWLRGVAAQSPPDVAFVAGELAAAERRSAHDARAAWPRAWRKVSDARLQ